MDSSDYCLNFIGVDDSGLDEEIINMRKNREKNSISNLKKVIKKITNFEDLHKWFYNEHNCYNCNFLERHKNICKTTRASY